MNRLVIIGNGFDLAHGLPTSYKHFIDDYWSSIKTDSHNDEFISFQNLKNQFQFEGTSNLEDLANFIIQYNDKIKFSDGEIFTEYGNNIKGEYPREHILVYNNSFFKVINQKKVIQKWVDVENEYYYQLKKIVKSECLDTRKTKEYWSNEQKIQIIKLNNEFEQVKELLEKYLNDKIIVGEERIAPISDLFKLDRRTDDYYLEFPSQDHETLKKFQNEYNFDLEIGKNIMTYYLNFNYTKTIDKYLNHAKKHGEDRVFGKVKNIQIHGRLNDISNRINFGFGDEMDDDYKIIENLDDNEYLKNFKSFQYLQNSNYKDLLDFVESDQKFQVYIMGHSCGLSDRTMLNTIFEHPNCRSIKVFYHEREDGTNNYTEIIQNISRHFNKKKLMREKIVNKTLCQPLTRIKFPLK
jgi:hypothetical protein